MKAFAIEAKGVRKIFDHQILLDCLDLCIKPGEFFGLVGSNGAGKTTLLKCMLDFCPLDAGEISLFGVDRSQVVSRQHLAYLPERFSPPYFLTGREFLYYMAKLYGNTWNNQIAEETITALDMDPTALDKSIRLLSKGMTQKLGLTACLLSHKSLLLLDEPMSGLDPLTRILFKQSLLKIKKISGTTLFFNTHLLVDVAEICDRMAILHGGRLCFVGTPSACLKQYGGVGLEEAYFRCIQAEGSMRGLSNKAHLP